MANGYYHIIHFMFDHGKLYNIQIGAASFRIYYVILPIIRYIGLPIAIIYEIVPCLININNVVLFVFAFVPLDIIYVCISWLVLS